MGRRDAVMIVGAILLIGIGGSVIKPCISGTVQKVSGARATLGFAIFYMVINIGSLFGRGTAFVVRNGAGVGTILAVVVVLAAGRGRHRLPRAADDEGGPQPLGHLVGDGRVHGDSSSQPPRSWPGSTAPRRPSASGPARRACRTSSPWRRMASLVAFFVVLFTYREPAVDANAPAKPKRSVGRILLDMVLVLGNGRFSIYLVVMSGFYFIYNQVYNVLPLYVKKVVETSPAMDLYTAANPFVIVCFQLILSRSFGKMKPIRSMVVGTVVIAVAMLINVLPIYAAGGPQAVMANWLPLGSVFIILTVALIALGELFTSPRMYEYIGALAPKGQEGLFLGYANLPLAIGALARRPGRRVHLQRDHGQGGDQAARRPARTRAGQQHAGLGDPDGDRLRVGRVAVAVQPVAGEADEGRA